jgi:hypothetical protein
VVSHLLDCIRVAFIVSSLPAQDNSVAGTLRKSGDCHHYRRIPLFFFHLHCYAVNQGETYAPNSNYDP